MSLVHKSSRLLENIQQLYQESQQNGGDSAENWALFTLMQEYDKYIATRAIELAFSVRKGTIEDFESEFQKIFDDIVPYGYEFPTHDYELKESTVYDDLPF